jgi:hypothetical protein
MRPEATNVWAGAEDTGPQIKRGKEEEAESPEVAGVSRSGVGGGAKEMEALWAGRLQEVEMSNKEEVGRMASEISRLQSECEAASRTAEAARYCMQ